MTETRLSFLSVLGYSWGLNASDSSFFLVSYLSGGEKHDIRVRPNFIGSYFYGQMTTRSGVEKELPSAPEIFSNCC